MTSSTFSTLSLLCGVWSLLLPGYRTIVPILWIFFSRLSMLSSFQRLLGNSINSLHSPSPVTDSFLKIRVASSSEICMILIFTDSQVSAVSKAILAALNRWGWQINGMYGCELLSLSLDESGVKNFCIAWCKCQRRIWFVPYENDGYIFFRCHTDLWWNIMTYWLLFPLYHTCI